MGEKIVTSCARNLTRSLPSGVKSGSWPPQRHTGPLTEGCFSFVGPKSCQSAIGQPQPSSMGADLLRRLKLKWRDRLRDFPENGDFNRKVGV